MTPCKRSFYCVHIGRRVAVGERGVASSLADMSAQRTARIGDPDLRYRAAVHNDARPAMATLMYKVRSGDVAEREKRNGGRFACH